MSNKILILGSDGYIGSRLLPYLKQNGYQVQGVDLCFYGQYHDNTIINDFDNLDSKFIQSFDSVILLAANSSVQSCQNNLKGTFDNNIKKFVNLILKLSHKQQFIFASSSSLYSGAYKNDITENYTDLNPTGYYDWSKKVIDEIIQLVPDLNYISCRFGTVCGASKNQRIDLMLPAMVNSALTNKKIKVFNPHILRPILGINDLCRCFKVFLENNDFERRGIYNLASFQIDVLSLSEKVGKILNVPVEVIEDESGIYPFSFKMSTELMQNSYDFTFEDTVESIVEDLKNNLDKVTKSKRDKALFNE